MYVPLTTAAEMVLHSWQIIQDLTFLRVDNWTKISHLYMYLLPTANLSCPINFLFIH